MTSPISAITAAAGAPSASGSASGLGGLGPDAFLQLLVAQLKYQNPMNPSDPTAMLQQVAMFTQVEVLNKVSASQSTLITLSEAQLATDLVGSEVAVSDGEDGQKVAGVVAATRFTTAGPVLILTDGTEIGLAEVTGVGTPAPTEPPAAEEGDPA